jgi:hypothetical protein
MTQLYQTLKIWFSENYGQLGFNLSPFYYIKNDISPKFNILRFGGRTEINGLSLKKIMDFTAGDSDLRKLLFDALFRQHGYNMDNDFVPLKQVKEFKL